MKGCKKLLELKNVTKYYKKGKEKVSVLENVSYKFKPKVFYCINGKSGSGKTTLVQLLGFLISLSDGVISINGKDVSKLSNNERAEFRNKEIGFIFQNYYLNPLMKAYENVMLPTYVNNLLSDSERKEKAYKLLSEVGLEGREIHFPKELSGGEQQRVAIARALVNNPNIILADEPSGSLDPENEENILKILKDLSNKGKCVIVVSHSKNVLKYADVVLKIESHKLVEVQK